MSTALVLSPTYTLDGTFVLNATDSYGVDWVVGEEIGWSDAAPVRLAVADREDAHGSFSGPVWRGARIINLKGIAIAPDRVTMLQAKDRLRGAGSYGEAPFELSVAEAHLTRAAWVKFSAETRMRDVNARAFEFELSLRADDPLRYGPTETVQVSLPASAGSDLTVPFTLPITLGVGSVGGTGVAYNSGTADTMPVFTVTGPVSAPAVLNATTGAVFSADLALADGEVLTVDTANRSMTVNGTYRFDALTAASSWWALVPGANEVRFSAATYATAPLLTVAWRPAWN